MPRKKKSTAPKRGAHAVNARLTPAQKRAKGMFFPWPPYFPTFMPWYSDDPTVKTWAQLLTRMEEEYGITDQRDLAKEYGVNDRWARRVWARWDRWRRTGAIVPTYNAEMAKMITEKHGRREE
jgi:hypothetical protein